jgi:hypothetical protein
LAHGGAGELGYLYTTSQGYSWDINYLTLPAYSGVN